MATLICRDTPVHGTTRSLSQALSLLLLPGLGRRAPPMATAQGTALGTAGDTARDTAGDKGDTGGSPGYVPGSVSAAFVTCPNQSVATELAR